MRNQMFVKQLSRKSSHQHAKRHEGTKKTRSKGSIETSVCRNIGNIIYMTKRTELVREVWNTNRASRNIVDLDLPTLVA